MTMLITGASGMLGTSLSKHIEGTCLRGRADLDLTDIEQTKNWLDGRRYDTIIHSAALTDLKYCEQNENQAKILHSSVVKVLNDFCDKLIYISTVPIWNKKGYRESVYFETKRLGEESTLKRNNNLVIRANIYGPSNLVRWAYDNLVQKKQINGYENSFFNPIHVDQLSSYLQKAINIANPTGVCTIASDKAISKYFFLKEVAKNLNLDDSLIAPHKLSEEQDLILEKPDILLSFKQGMELIKNDFKNK